MQSGDVWFPTHVVSFVFPLSAFYPFRKDERDRIGDAEDTSTRMVGNDEDVYARPGKHKREKDALSCRQSGSFAFFLSSYLSKEGKEREDTEDN